MKHLFIAAVGLMGLCGHAQVTELRPFKQVTALEVSNGIEVIYTQSDSGEVKAESDSREHLKNVITEYKGNTLKVYMKDTEGANIATTARVYVSQKDVNNFKAYNAAVIKVSGVLTTTNITLNLSQGATFGAIVVTAGNCSIDAKSGAGFTGKVTAKTFKADITNGSYVKILGNSDVADVYCSSGASFNADKFMCSTADVWAKNASSVSIHSINYIKTKVDISSSVTYTGTPANTNLGMNTYAIKRDIGNLIPN
jgi:hypothetical protein